jgi:hypothetical protein
MKLHRSIPKCHPDQTCAIRETAKIENLQQSQNSPLPIHPANENTSARERKELKLQQKISMH